MDIFASVREHTRDEAWAHIMLQLRVCAHMLGWALREQVMLMNRVCCLLSCILGARTVQDVLCAAV